MPIHPDAQELLGEHLRYEIDMLRETLHRIPSSTDQVTTYALLESHYTHARGLIEFLLGEKKRAAQDFVNPPYQPFSGKNGRVDHFVQKLNQQISHLIYGRTADASKKLSDTEQAELYELIRCAVMHFKSRMKQEYQHIDIGDLPPLTMVLASAHMASATNSITATTTHSGSSITPTVTSPTIGPIGPSGPQVSQPTWGPTLPMNPRSR